MTGDRIQKTKHEESAQIPDEIKQVVKSYQRIVVICGGYVSYMRRFKHADRARRPVRIGRCSFKKKRKPPKPVVVGSKPTGPASPIGYNAI